MNKYESNKQLQKKSIAVTFLKLCLLIKWPVRMVNNGEVRVDYFEYVPRTPIEVFKRWVYVRKLRNNTNYMLDNKDEIQKELNKPW